MSASPAEPPSKPRIALIHALAASVEPINGALQRLWPAARRMNLLDDSLSADLAASPAGLDAAMTGRFLALADYAVGSGAQALLFTCSAFGPCIDAVKARHPSLPVLKPNEAMVDAAVAWAERFGPSVRVGLLATFGPTLASMPPEFPPGLVLDCELAEGALTALQAGDLEVHDRLAVEAARRLAERGCALIALAQFSLARAAPAIEAALGMPVLTTPDSAVAALRRRLVIG
ncbi:MAG TPA: aspartate/glutamate racemase family protein [Burkholderiaceae bacterium]|nr:aspartate/glutamate racemase family protein [Burkholderiaceae bacterium]HMX11920.1 aspartate/glutamate racemase family protein [Burkholderiaceae bacterium]HMZ01336.1 aspartate/glutamate racemase family protein [Burkholderiaceae bacterium]HNB46619.1 aspartate/glutamate racemase family protein [Burkholderiaceae bacterium]HNG78956.1 aspartate/glutamate racemase family protein [Burkholderiaceae bacterium]